MRKSRNLRRRALLAAAATAVVALAGAGVANMQLASAASAGCSVGYTVTAQWSGGFGANVIVTNLGDQVNGWH